MFKVLIIDDEVSVVEGLKKTISWGNHGFEVIGEAHNGLEGLEKIIELRPNLVITDITMPFIDGIEMIERAKTTYPNFYVIFLTCHAEFDLTVKAIKLNAWDYLIKETLEREELYKALNKINSKLTEEMNRKVIENQMNWEFNKNLYLIGETIINELLQGTYKYSDALKPNTKLYNFNFNKDKFVLSMIELDNYSFFIVNNRFSNKELLRFVILNVIEEILRKNEFGVAFSRSDKEYFILYNYHSNIKDNVFDQIKSISREIQNHLKAVVESSVSVYISKNTDEINNIPLLYEQILELKKERFYLHAEVVISKNDFFLQETSSDNVPGEYGSLIKLYENSLENKDIVWMKTIVNEFVDKAGKNKYGVEYVRQVIGRMFFALSDYMEKQILKYTEQTITAPYLKIINELETIYELKEVLIEHSQKAIELVSDTAVNSTDNEIIKVIQYINKHIDEHITLEFVSKYICMNSSYFCRYFKIKTGENFIEYLSKLRIEKAKELLLSTALTIDEIACKVGYVNPVYFMKVFKKITGFTSGEYRKNSKLNALSYG